MSADIDPDANRRGAEPTVRTPEGTGLDAVDRDRDADDRASRPNPVDEPASGADPVPAAGLFERVLVVTDGTETGESAVEAGIDLASAHGATVDALYVVDTTEHWDVVVERREREGEAAVEAAEARGRDRGVDVEKWFRYGTAHEEVLDFADAHGVDLVVLGSARRTGLDRLVRPEPLPTRVQRGGSVPVLVVGVDDGR
ncbi:Nucleotide-binding universal stress protein, UspA family [Halorubrum aquaticum]|uniref:Nucleotide-binding universal stress protein, UspA family n=1 Tax=Halorubrum aquaticum TaxID=387340 RepID=A0A1I3CIE0_9EURY|nr:universal stress protein [Halorubrum aquaticum]SFH74096.1 Nucleotide-binding universal stress protein, UspA family [Halorubrum aquaticum]